VDRRISSPYLVPREVAVWIVELSSDVALGQKSACVGQLAVRMRSNGSRAWIGELVVRRVFQRKTRNDTALIVDTPCGVAFVRKPCVSRMASCPLCVPTQTRDHTACVGGVALRSAFQRSLATRCAYQRRNCVPTQSWRINAAKRLSALQRSGLRTNAFNAPNAAVRRNAKLFFLMIAYGRQLCVDREITASAAF
jgi:hypothetical protein